MSSILLPAIILFSLCIIFFILFLYCRYKIKDIVYGYDNYDNYDSCADYTFTGFIICLVFSVLLFIGWGVNYNHDKNTYTQKIQDYQQQYDMITDNLKNYKNDKEHTFLYNVYHNKAKQYNDRIEQEQSYFICKEIGIYSDISILQLKEIDISEF